MRSTDDGARVLGEDVPPALAFDDTPVEVPTLRVALVRPASFLPNELSISDQDAVIVADLLYDGLTEATASGELVPGLATSWSVTDDGYAWTFVLDTERIHAGEVVASLDRLRAQGTTSPAGVVLADVAFIEAVDEATVRMVMETPNAGLPWILSGVSYSVALDSDAPTGRFSVIENDDDSMLLASGLDGPDALQVELLWMSECEDTLAALDGGDADAAVVGAGELVDAVGEYAAAMQARSIVRYFGLDLRAPVFADARVRAAVLAAIDRDAVRAVLGGPVLPLDGMVAPTLAGFAGEGCGSGCLYDPERARALLAEVGGAPAVTIGYTDATQLPVAQAMAEQLGAVGFTAGVLEVAPDGLASAVESGTVQVFAYGWAAPAGSIDAVIPPMLGVVGGANAIGFVSEPVDAAIARARLLVDDEERWTALREAHQGALDAAGLIPIGSAPSRFVIDPEFAGVVVRADGSIEIRDLP